MTRRQPKPILLTGYRTVEGTKVKGSIFALPISVVQTTPTAFDVGHGETFERYLTREEACHALGEAVLHELERDGLIKPEKEDGK